MKLWVHIPYENKIFYIPYMTLWVPISYMNIEFSIFLIWKHGCIYQFQLSYFKSWKMILWKCCTQYVSKFGKLVSGHRTGKDQFSFQSQRKTIPSNVQNSPSQAQQYVNRELPDVQAGFRKGRGTRDQIGNIRWIMEKAREFQKNIYFCFIDYAKTFDCVNHNKLWKILKDMGLPDHLTCLMRNLYAGQEATVRAGHGTTDWFQIGKGVCQDCTLSLCLFNLYAVYIMRNSGLEEAQAGIKIARRNISKLKYADDTTLMAENEEELKNLLMRVKEESEKLAYSWTFRKRRSWYLVPSLHGK